VNEGSALYGKCDFGVTCVNDDTPGRWNRCVTSPPGPSPVPVGPSPVPVGPSPVPVGPSKEYEIRNIEIVGASVAIVIGVLLLVLFTRH
jgi:hypothetical protein